MAIKELISTITISSGGATTIDFTSIPQGYTDVELFLSARTTDTGAQWAPVQVALNGSTAGLTEKYLDGYGTGNASAGGNSVEMWACGSPATANTFGNSKMLIANYAGSEYKGMSIDNVSESNQNASIVLLTVAQWANTAAVSRITLTAGNSSSFVQYSTASLYGFKKGSDGITTVA